MVRACLAALLAAAHVLLAAAASIDAVSALDVVPAGDSAARISFVTHGSLYALEVYADGGLSHLGNEGVATTARSLVVADVHGDAVHVERPDLARLLVYRRGGDVGVIGTVHYAGMALTLQESRDLASGEPGRVPLVAELRAAGEALRDPATGAPLRCGNGPGHAVHGAHPSLLRRLLSLVAPEMDYEHAHKDHARMRYPHAGVESSLVVAERGYAKSAADPDAGPSAAGQNAVSTTSDGVGTQTGPSRVESSPTEHGDAYTGSPMPADDASAGADTPPAYGEKGRASAPTGPPRDETVRVVRRRMAGPEGRVRQTSDAPGGADAAQCPPTPRLLPVAVVADCNYVARMGGAEAARRQLLSELNAVSGMFLQAFNIGLAVTQVLVFEECDGRDVWDDADVFNIPCGSYPGLETVLNRFSRWRDAGLDDADAPSAAVVHLVTACNYSDRVGLAWLNQVCRTRSFTDSMADTISGTSLSVAVFPADPYWGDRAAHTAAKGRATGSRSHAKAQSDGSAGLAHYGTSVLVRPSHPAGGGAGPSGPGGAVSSGTGAVGQTAAVEHGSTSLGQDGIPGVASPADQSHRAAAKGASVAGSAPLQHYAVIAHELGHSLGAVHDCTDETCGAGGADEASGDAARGGRMCCKCADGPDACSCGDRYVMTPNIGRLLRGGESRGGWAFSPCAVADVCGKLAYLGGCLVDERGSRDALSAQNVSAPASSSEAVVGASLVATCGNGVREGDEECDAGAEDACCTADCRLKPGAACADANDACCLSCRVVSKTSGTTCRPGGPCVEDATCDGVSPGCPAGRPRADGVPCGATRLLSDAGGVCASGVCTSRDEQCAVFGRHMGLRASCPYTRRSCSVICAAGDVCVDMHANFADGTPCGAGGSCRGGMCSEFGSASVRPAALGGALAIGAVAALL